MTRGKFVLITENTVFVSCEFNGDMYYDGGFGIEVVKKLEKVFNYDSFVKAVKEFDLANFGYQNDDDDYFNIYDYEISPDKINFKDNYFSTWFSDYLYVLNLSKKPRNIQGKDKKITINESEIQVYNFGKFYGTSLKRHSNGNIVCGDDLGN